MSEESDEQKVRGASAAPSGGPQVQAAKKPYAKPRLTFYGNVDEITRGADMGNKDGNNTGNSITGSV